ncbi:hypothetical protein ACOMHN_013809 [Nucella lapillus]
MPVENLEEEGLPKNPNLELAQLKFHLECPKFKNDEAAKSKLLETIKGDNMAPFYEEVCRDLGWKVEEKLLTLMKTANEEKLKKLDEAIEDAEKNLGETEIRDAMLAKAEFLSKIGDKAGALTQFRQTYDKTVALGYRLDVVFHLIRLGLFYMDHDLINKNLEKAQTLIDEGGDWDRRNRLKVYRGVYCMSIRQFKEAAGLFLDTIATFTSYELMDYPKFVTYTVLCSVIALERPKLREKVGGGRKGLTGRGVGGGGGEKDEKRQGVDYPQFVTYTVLCSVIVLERPKLREKVGGGRKGLTVLCSVIALERPKLREKVGGRNGLTVVGGGGGGYPKFVTYTVLCSVIALERPKLREKVTKGSEILEVLHGLPKIKRYLFSLYDCHYSDFFLSLVEVEDLMQTDRLMAAHYRYYVREMRIMAYAQLLESYRSLTLDYMAQAFGVTVHFIDQELARFIAAGRLHCKIDKVGGIVETNRPDSKNWQYQSTIKHGDILLNRVQKLSRVINI